MLGTSTGSSTLGSLCLSSVFADWARERRRMIGSSLEDFPHRERPPMVSEPWWQEDSGRMEGRQG